MRLFVIKIAIKAKTYVKHNLIKIRVICKGISQINRIQDRNPCLIFLKVIFVKKMA